MVFVSIGLVQINFMAAIRQSSFLIMSRSVQVSTRKMIGFFLQFAQYIDMVEKNRNKVDDMIRTPNTLMFINTLSLWSLVAWSFQVHVDVGWKNNVIPSILRLQLILSCRVWANCLKLGVLSRSLLTRLGPILLSTCPCTHGRCWAFSHLMLAWNAFP